MKKKYTAKEVLEKTQFSMSRFYYWISKGKITAYPVKNPTHSHRYDFDEQTIKDTLAVKNCNCLRVVKL